LLQRADDGSVLGGSAAYRPGTLADILGLHSDGLYRLSDTHAQEILNMRLQRLTGLEQDKIVNEYRGIMDDIADLLDILAKPERITAIISDELVAIKAEFATNAKDVRRSEVIMNATELDTEDLITPADM